jgi:hypothetical protein
MSLRNTCVWAAVLLLAAGQATAQHSADFEGLNASPDGVQLNDQDGYYNPDPPNSVSCLVYTYDGNVLGLPQNGGGSEQFVGCTGPAGNRFARSQKDVPYGDGTGQWVASMDVAITFTGNLPTAQNTGSFSTQLHPNAATMILLARWTDPNTAQTWNADAVWFSATNVQLIEALPDNRFQNLAIDHWYRWSLKFDLDTNLVLSISITDLDTNETATYEPVDRYLWGGSAGAPPPTGLRFFAGATANAGNTTCWDNLEIAPVVEGCVRDPAWVCDGDVDGNGAVNPVDSGLVQAAFGSTDEQDLCNYDLDCNGAINPVDAGLVQSLFGTCDPPRDECP